MVARDIACNDDPLGWVDLHKIARRSSEVSVRIEGQYVTRTETRPYVVSKMVPEERTKKVRVRRNGRWVVEEWRYRVFKRVCETRTRQVKVRRPDLELKVNHGGRILGIEEFFRVTDTNTNP